MGMYFTRCCRMEHMLNSNLCVLKNRLTQVQIWIWMKFWIS